MASKIKTQVIIAGKIYTLSGYESEEYLQRVATYLNGRIAECRGLDGYQRMSPELKGILLDLNVADDYFKAKKRVEELEQELSEKDKELYELKHELITAQIRLENAGKDAAALEEKNARLEKENIQMETKLQNQNQKPRQ